jgi:hypothetical protein
VVVVKAVLAVAVVVLALPSSADAWKKIRTNAEGQVSSLGKFTVREDGYSRSAGRLDKAVDAFGSPDVRRLNQYGSCRVRWDRLGLRILFVNFGLIPGDGHDTCDGRYGYAQKMAIEGPGSRKWRTQRGLRVGMTLGALRKRHPEAVRHHNGYWLTTQMTPYGDGCPCPQAGLRATTDNGRVASFRSWLSTAGD